ERAVDVGIGNRPGPAALAVVDGDVAAARVNVGARRDVLVDHLCGERTAAGHDVLTGCSLSCGSGDHGDERQGAAEKQMLPHGGTSWVLRASRAPIEGPGLRVAALSGRPS